MGIGEQVRRGKAQMPAKLVAMCNAARHRERPAEQCGSVRKIAVSQRVTHSGAGRALRFDSHRAHPFDAELPRLRSQQRKIATATFAEAKIIADQDPTRVQALFENFVNEGFGR